MADNDFVPPCYILNHVLSSVTASYGYFPFSFCFVEADDIDACLFKSLHFSNYCVFLVSRVRCNLTSKQLELDFIVQT